MAFHSGVTKRYSKDPYPPIELSETAVLQVLEEALVEGQLGLDLEYNPETEKPYILGLASRGSAAACWWKNTLAQRVIDRCHETGCLIVGHNVLGADKPVIEKTLSITTPVEMWDDSMLRAYLANQDFAAAPGKEEDDKDKGSLGLMNLGTMSTYYLGIPMYKACRGSECFGPCPEHEERSYCAVDAWAGLRIAQEAKLEFAKKGISEPLYRDLKRLALYCDKMQQQGIKIDRELIAELEGKIKEKKDNLFPSEMKLATPRSKKEKKCWLTPFNPNSPKQVAEWFKENGIELKAKKGSPTSRDTIRYSLEKELRRLKVPYEVDKKLGTLSITDEESILPDPVEYLYRLDQSKRAGKGMKAWFSDRYFDKEDQIHPRFNVCGTSTGRLSSSNPNFQNCPKRGFGSLVRAAIIPRNSKLKIAKADKMQLEARIIFSYSGSKQPKTDMFTELVVAGKGKFDEAAARIGMKPRDIVKSIVYGYIYGEGMVHLKEDDLKTTTRQREIKAGALAVMDGREGRMLWEYRGGLIGFTGSNLSERLFGDKTNEHRREALIVQEMFSSIRPEVREWQRGVSHRIEKEGLIVSHTGRVLRLYGTPEENLKLSLSVMGQGGGADEVQECMLRFDSLGQVALIQVHDELVFEVPREYTNEQVVKFFEPFCEPSERFGGISFPIEISVGDNWCGASDLNPDGLVVIS